MPSLSISPETIEEVHEYRTLTSDPAGMLVRRNVYPAGRKHRTRYRLTWQLATAVEVSDLLSFFRTINGGGSFTWTPPGGSSGTYRTVDEDLSVSHTNHATHTVDLMIEEV